MSPDGQREKAERLRALHHGPEPLLLANVWDVTSARVVAAVPGCKAVATSSAAVARALGWEDGERIPAGEMVAAVARIAAAVELPVTADLEAGYGDPAGTAAAAIEAGAVGMNLEDRVRPIDQQVARICEVVAAGRRLGVPLVLNARTDVFLDGSHEVGEAVERANAYLAAGADCAFVIGVADGDTIATLAREIDGPLNVLVQSDSPSVPELAAMGVRRISVGSRLHHASLAFVDRAARGLLERGSPELG